MQYLYVIKVEWRHDAQLGGECILVQGSSGEDAVRRANELLPTRISQANNIRLASKAEKMPDNCFMVCGKNPALPKAVSTVGASF